MSSIQRKSRTWLVILLGILVVGHVGAWPMPNLPGQYAISQSLTRNPFSDPNAQYLVTNFLAPALFGVLGGDSLRGYGFYSLITAVVFVGAFSVWFIAFHGRKVAIEELKLPGALAFSVFFIPFYWIGMDGMTLLLMLAILLLFGRRTAVVPALLLGLQHFEQGMVAFLILLFTIAVYALAHREARKKEELIWVAMVLMAIWIGKLFLIAWFAINDFELAGSRGSVLVSNLSQFISVWRQWWIQLLWSFLFVGWLLVVRYASRTWPLVIAAVIALALAAIVGDPSRVGIILLFPATFYWVFRNRDVWVTMSRRLLITLIVGALLAPPTIVWGVPHGGLWRYDIQFVKRLMSDDRPMQPFDWLRPFR